VPQKTTNEQHVIGRPTDDIATIRRKRTVLAPILVTAFAARKRITREIAMMYGLAPATTAAAGPTLAGPCAASPFAVASDGNGTCSDGGSFRRNYPAFAATSFLDELRATEYAGLDALGQVYLDYTGGGLYAASQVRDHLRLLSGRVFGNPHSSNPTSQAMTELDERARAFVLSFFNASPDEYTVIFTPNASGALRLVGEAYPFMPDGHYLLSVDNHNSVNGIREFARAKGAPSSYAPLEAAQMSRSRQSIDASDSAPHSRSAPPRSAPTSPRPDACP
jgi:Aminotransferase class-V